MPAPSTVFVCCCCCVWCAAEAGDEERAARAGGHPSAAASRAAAVPRAARLLFPLEATCPTTAPPFEFPVECWLLRGGGESGEEEPLPTAALPPLPALPTRPPSLCAARAIATLPAPAPPSLPPPLELEERGARGMTILATAFPPRESSLMLERLLRGGAAPPPEPPPPPPPVCPLLEPGARVPFATRGVAALPTRATPEP